MKKRKVLQSVITLALISTLLLTGCGNKSEETEASADNTKEAETSVTEAADATEGETIKIGISFGTLQEERWEAERARFVELAEKMENVEVVYTDANHDAQTQNNQIENLISQGVDILVIGAQDNEAAAVGAEAAKKAGIPVISYARIINTDQQDLIVSYDYMDIGEANAKFALELVPEGKYMLVNGHDADSIPHDINTGYHTVLDSVISSGKINVVYDQYIENWDPDGAMSAVENILTKENNDVQAIICNNDGMAGGVVQALTGQGLDGKVVVLGMDCDLAACQRIAEGTQAGTVLTGYNQLADAIFNAALAIVKGTQVEGINSEEVINGVSIPAIHLEPTIVTKENLKEVVIDTGMHALEDVYLNVPKEEWPQ